MRGHKQFEKYNANCITNEDIILRYIRCFIDGIILNVTRINEMYPKVRALYWQCRGYCSISNPIVSVHVYGCQKSKYDVSNIYIIYFYNRHRCFIDGIILNVTRINEMYPKVRALYWRCRGYCSISNPIVSVEDVGMLFLTYIIYFLQYAESNSSAEHVYEDFHPANIFTPADISEVRIYLR